MRTRPPCRYMKLSQQPQIQQLDLEAECLAEQDQGDDDHHAHA